MMTRALLLMHGVHVPIEAREALRAAPAAPMAYRRQMLESAARVLVEQTTLDRGEARELVYPTEGGCG